MLTTALVTSLLASALAGAIGHVPLQPDGPFAIETGGARLAVTDYAVPKAVRLPEPDRSCRLDLAWSRAGGLEPSAISCHPDVRESALEAARAWKLQVPLEAAAVELPELWFVFPGEGGGLVRTFLRPREGIELSLPSGVDALPYAIQAWDFVTYPESEPPNGPDVTCAVDLLIDPSGIPREVEASGCREPFRGEARRALARWRFHSAEIDGGAIDTALSLITTFRWSEEGLTANVPERYDPEGPGLAAVLEDLDPDQRVRYLKANFFGVDYSRGPGTVTVRLPPRADIGGRAPTDFFDEDWRRRQPPPEPTGDPTLVLQHGRYGEVEVHAWTLPEPLALGREVRCKVLVQVDGNRVTWAWAEDPCDTAARVPSIAAADQFSLVHRGPKLGEARARFRATYVFPADGGEPELELPWDDVRTPLKELPELVVAVRAPKLQHHVLPRRPRGLAPTDEACLLAVDVDHRGRPAEVRPTDCDEAYQGAALKAVRRFRWQPAMRGTEPIDGQAQVSIRFAD